MAKKAQITIFIVLGIILLVMISFLIYSNSFSLNKKTLQTEEDLLDTTPLKMFIESCIKHTLQ